MPRLSDIFHEHQPERTAERSVATNILANYAADQLLVLANLLMDADEKQFAVTFPRFKEQGEPGLAVLTAEIDKTLPTELPSSDEGREKLAKRQANAAVAMLKMNQSAKVWPLLRHSPDPRVRSYLIHRLSPLGADAKCLVRRLDEEADQAILRALLLSLGEFGEKELPPDERKILFPRLNTMYRTAGDPGIHGAGEWLLRTWKQDPWLKQVNDEWAKNDEQRAKRLEEIKRTLAKDKEKTPPQWYVNGQGQTIVVIPGPADSVTGSPTEEEGRYSSIEQQRLVRIPRSFAVGSAPVTKEQYLQFNPLFTHNEMYMYPTPTCPIGGVNWSEAAAYCNWLSEQEGIDPKQWCYEFAPDGAVAKMKENYLHLTGYRLPTEAEMEYVSRAGAKTSRYFGESEDLLPQYAWYLKNSKDRAWPVGALKPNDLGLFDVYGNVYCWCQNRIDHTYPKVDEIAEDQERTLEFDPFTMRMLKGGSFYLQPSLLRSARRNGRYPTDRSRDIGFRVARTIIP